MSHLPERTEKKCLNCNVDLYDRYCHKCGQENIEPQETVWHLFVHFFNDFTHFDGKFFRTILLLITKPGFLSDEYMKGRRAGYLNPVKMYIFTSAFFFLLFFTISDPTLKPTITKKGNTTQVTLFGESDQQHLQDSLTREVFTDEDDQPNTVAAYDSLQKALPPSKRDNFIDRYFNRRIIAAQEYALNNPALAFSELTNKFLHSFPQMLFISLPFFALFLYLLNFNRRKTFYYVSHVIFTIHLYCATFIFLLLLMLISKIPLQVVSVVATVVFVICTQVYLFLAMKRFYRQKTGILVLQYVCLNILSSVLISLLMFAYLFNVLLALAKG